MRDAGPLCGHVRQHKPLRAAAFEAGNRVQVGELVGVSQQPRTARVARAAQWAPGEKRKALCLTVPAVQRASDHDTVAVVSIARDN